MSADNETAAAIVTRWNASAALSSLVPGGLHKDRLVTPSATPYARLQVKAGRSRSDFSSGSRYIDYRLATITLWGIGDVNTGNIVRTIKAIFDEKPLTFTDSTVAWMRTETLPETIAEEDKIRQGQEYRAASIPYCVWTDRRIPTDIIVSPSSLPPWTVGAAYSQTFTATGGYGSFTWSTSGTLPTGLTFSAGVLSGTPSAQGTFSFTITATDQNGVTGSDTYTLTINAAPTITTGSPLPAGTSGTPYSQQLAATGGTVVTPGVYTWSLTSGSLPPGISLSSGGLLSGTP